MINKTKIICTIGPASGSVKVLEKLIDKGMDIARLNFSHGELNTHLEYIKNVRKAAGNKFIPIMQDLQGPKIRVGKLQNSSIWLKEGRKITIKSKDVLGNEQSFSTTYRDFVRDVKKGEFILLDDGLLRLRIVEKSKNEVLCLVLKGGLLKEHKGINLPNSKISIPSLTEKDKENLMFGLKHNVDAVALSFVRTEDDILELKDLIRKLGKNVPVVAKIERPEAIENIDGIIDAADVIMVARGDMGVEISPEDVPVLQKTIIKKCNVKCKPVITATQMLESMTNSRIPTRAEATDVANSILDGTDCVMLSGETSVGVDPVNVVETMEKIIEKIENYRKPKFWNYDCTNDELRSVCKSAVTLANDLNAKSIVTFTKTGKSPKYLSSYRVNSEIVAITENNFINTFNHFLWGVLGIRIKKSMNMEEITDFTLKELSKVKALKKKDKVILLLSSSRDKFKSADTIRVIVK